MTPSTKTVTGAELLLLLLGLGEAGTSSRGIDGITRLQKLLFLLWQEEGVEEVNEAFKYRPYKAGPYSRKLYDELQLLENLGLVQSEVVGQATDAEAAEIEALSFEQLMGDGAAPFMDTATRDDAQTADAFQERRFGITPKGLQVTEQLLKRDGADALTGKIRRLKTKFANYSLQDLLYYVYTKYEKDGWTSESEIRDQVLRKGKKR